ncbi:MAG TPA: DMT family transporter [Methanospirillum sp.]|nr:DMT family transporter [Methanospirillum sp.]
MPHLPARPVLYVLFAAFLFGSAAPLAKMVLSGVGPVTLASFIYLGSGGGMAVFRLIRYLSGERPREAPLTRRSVPWVIGASFFGAVLATTSLTFSLSMLPAWEASVLLSFEAVATALVAGILFAEYSGPRVIAALGCITLACIILTWHPGLPFGFSAGAVGVLFTCLCWGIDTSFSRQIAGRDPVSIVMYKGLFAGVVTLLISRIIGEPLPGMFSASAAILLGLTGFGGLMTFCFLKALRDLGPARTGSYFGVNPVFGIIVGLLIFRDMPGPAFIPAVVLMLAGIAILMTEDHHHSHHHPPVVHDHRHRHDDGHHLHDHPGGFISSDPGEVHTHLHAHNEIIHTHSHTPDLHHQHRHS